MRQAILTQRRSAAHRRSLRAFTLPEVLATLVLVGVILPAVMKGISLSMAVSDDAKKKIQATALAENKLAELSADAMSGVTQMGGATGDFGPDLPGFRWEASTTTIDVDLTEVSVRVAWSSRGSERQVDLSTCIYTGSSAQASGTTAATGGGY